MKKIFLLLFFAAFALNGVCAYTLEDAKKVLAEGDVSEARQILERLSNDNPKIKTNPQFLYVSGVCEFESGNRSKARTLLEEANKKGNGAANLYLGRLAFLDYDFDSASEYYDDFRRYREKHKLPGEETLEVFEQQLNTAENALERVEKIVVIDSIALPSDSFYEYYKLPSSAGRILTPFEMPLDNHKDGIEMAFLNESGDYLIWAEPDSTGNVGLVETIRLVDGTWQNPVEAPADILNKNGQADYPFMMADGTTLYYASDGNDSMGGYDIYVVTRDAATGEFLQPLNMGMPFNSPYDDYMLAIDEENGIGWWATDRNQLGDKVTVYVYLINDLRKNYDPDDEMIIEMAKLSDFRATHNPDDAGKYEDMLSLLEDIDKNENTRQPEFTLPVGDGKFYHFYEEFRNSSAKDAMKSYLAVSADVESAEAQLQKLYKQYSSNKSANVKNEILKLEKELDGMRKALVSKRSDVYRLENLNK